MTRPFRIISSVELRELHDHFNQVINNWQDNYASGSITSELQVSPPEYFINQGYMLIKDEINLGALDANYVTWGNQTLFGEDLPCFHQTTTAIMELLFQELVQTPKCSIAQESIALPQWFYRGSTCLQLLLHCNQNTLAITLSPDWVLQKLAHHTSSVQRLGSLDKALEQHNLKVELMLQPINLPLQHVFNIQIGDVIATDHPINTSINLCREQQVLVKATLGQQGIYKSIVLERSS